MDRSRPEATTTGAADTPKFASDSERYGLPLDLRGLLSGALQRLVESTDAEMAAAWALDRDGSALELAAVGARPTGPPDTAAMPALGRLRRATDLSEPGLDPTLAALARERGFGVAAILPAPDAEASEAGEPRPIAVLLLGFQADAPGALPKPRPRTLAALDQVVERLRAPAATADTVSRLSRVDDELMRVMRLASAGNLLAEVVHEVRNPLVSVKTFLQLLPENLEDPDFVTNFRRVVLDEVRRMERLLDAVLQQAQPAPDAETSPRTALGPVIESVGRLLEKRGQQKELTLTIDVGADLPPAAIGEDPLRQIVLNLALNAIEASRPGGCVRLSGVSARRDEAEAVDFVVDDEGPGIPEGLRARLFDPFFSTRSERPGGFGLAVCSRLAREAGASIRVESSPQGGARFRVCLPSP